LFPWLFCLLLLVSGFMNIEENLIPDDPYDQQLIANCHPPNYTNPVPAGKYNLVAIGAGAGGLVSAGGAGSLGAKSALVERALTGGDCLNTGCVPSKALTRAARAVYDTSRANEFGVRFTSAPETDFAIAMERLRRLRARISLADSIEVFRRKYNVDVFLGDASFISPTAIAVNGDRLLFDRAVIATGGRPSVPPIPGLKEAGFYTNETIFKLTELPSHLVVIGGGATGCELGQAFLRFGCSITLINDAVRILPREDPDAALIVHRQLEAEGMAIINRANILRVESRGAGKAVVFLQDGVESEVVCQAILLAAGRVPNLEGLNLEAAGVSYSQAGVIVDDYLRTSNRRIYAAGDICSQYKFTHAADAMARSVLRNALFFGHSKITVMPSVIYTDPEVAHTGAYEADARAKGLEVATITERFSDLDRAILDGEDEGFAKVHYDRRSGKILGGTIVARHAGEMISELTLAITYGLRMEALSRTIHPYPTQSESLRKIGDSYMQTQLQPWLRQLLKMWFDWRR
jgi:pyruvate/2-oxoglutarate dehydrogenase complex dihydrolipoamide dehydrogenase (E3) component